MHKTRESLFQKVVKEACRDGKISPEEFAILKKLSALLGIEINTANTLAAEIIDKYKAGELEFTPIDKPEELYRDVLLSFNDDNVIDGNEEALLETIKNWLGLPAQETATSGDADSEATHESILEANGDIKPLRCDNCNGQIPLLRRREVKCPYCSASKTIPNAYLEALASRTSFETRRKQALKLFDKLGSKPSTFEETLAELDQQMLLVSFVLSLGFIIATVQFIVFYPLDWYYARFLQLNMTDVIPHWLPAMLATLVTFFLSVVPFGLLYIVRRKVLSLKHVQIALSANPPQKPGGPATCRSCGSPFEVPPNAAGVTCPYCQTDNLLQVPAVWLQETRDLSIRVGKSATTAENVFKKETRLGWESVLSVFLLFLFIGGVNWLWLSELKPPEHLRQEMAWLECYYDEIADKRLVRQVKSIGKDFPVGEWIEDAHEIEEFYIALAPGEKLQLTWDISSETIKLQNYSELQAAMYLVRGYSEGFSHQIESKRFTRLDPGVFSTGYGGWYRVKLLHEDMIVYKLKADLVAPEK